MNVIKKILISLVLISCISIIYSMNKIEVSATDWQTQADGFIDQGKSKIGGFDVSTVTDNFVPLGQILSYIGAGVMVAVTAYLGIQYLISPPDKQGALKQKLIGVVVSGIVIFGAYQIWKIVLDIVSSF